MIEDDRRETEKRRVLSNEEKQLIRQGESVIAVLMYQSGHTARDIEEALR